MKKTYKKPVVIFESFQLSRQVMACTNTLNATDTANCVTSNKGWVQANIFTTANQNCLIKEDTGYCYTNSTTNAGNEFYDSMQLFTS